MTQWTFQFSEFIDSIDEFATEHGDEDFRFAWSYTQHMVNAHGLAIGGDAPEQESIAIAWSQFEDTFDDDEDGSVVSLTGIIHNLFCAVPIGTNSEFLRALQIGFARARGFSKEDAIKEYEKWLTEHDEESIDIGRNEFQGLGLDDSQGNPIDIRKTFTLIEGGQYEH